MCHLMKKGWKTLEIWVSSTPSAILEIVKILITAKMLIDEAK